jgi:hypothetical protein
MMRRTQILGFALPLLVFGASASARAQDPHRQRQQQQQQPAPTHVAPAEQQQRVQEQQQRAAQYRQHLDRQVPAIHQETAQLQQQKRAEQYRVQQEYEARLQQQQRNLQAARDYSRDPYVSTPHSYRYTVGGVARQTNQYGADVLRQAVNYGYQEGYQAGRADRQDHWQPNYQNSIAYRDANYGYNGNYVDQSDYNYYFREGFQRGYDDGYNSRSQYGRNLNGTPTILGNLLTSILGLQSIR